MLGSILNSSPKPGECYNLKGIKKTQLSYLKIKKQSPLLHLVMFEILLIEMNSFAFSSWLQRCLRCHILKIVLDIHILLWKSVFQKYSCEYIVMDKEMIWRELFWNLREGKKEHRDQVCSALRATKHTQHPATPR